MTTIKRKDIAAAASVSLATVTRALNGSGYVSDETREAVLATARSLGYIKETAIPNDCNVIAVVLPPKIYNLFSYEITIPLFYELQLIGKYPLLLLNHVNNKSIPALIEEAKSLRTKGAIFVHFEEGIMEPEVSSLIKNSNFPMVFMDYPVGETFRNDNAEYGFESTRLATDYLIQSGHKKVAYIGCNSRYPSEVTRLNGYLSALRQCGLSADESLIVTRPQHSPELGRDAAHELVARDREFTALVCSSDYLAVGGVRALKEMGKRIPQDISVIGLFNYCSMYTDPPLTTVSFPYEALARLAVTSLINNRGSGYTPLPTIKVKPNLIHRESTRPLD